MKTKPTESRGNITYPKPSCFLRVASWRNRFSWFGVFALVVLMAANVFAQRTPGTISGRVIGEDGQPIPHAKVRISDAGGGGVAKMLAGRTQVVTDETGAFQADKLEPAAYKITATAPGYVIAPDAIGDAQKYVHVGDSVTIRMIRGGVITGKVLNAVGEPVIGISIEMTRVRDEQGRPVTDPMMISDFTMANQTDDRGIYRIYGLAPGSYLVSVGAGSLGFSIKPTPFAGRAKIYYPSATRDTAIEVAVRSGDEINGIDIRYRVERGSAITGKVTGAPATSENPMEATGSFVMLNKAGTDVLIGTVAVIPFGDNPGYSFYGLPNGEYELTAVRPDLNNSSVMTSAVRRVTVSGRDVTGVDLKLEAMASISGSIALEKMATPPSGQKCETGRDSFLDEITLQAKPDTTNQKAPVNLSSFGLSAATVPNDKGAFSINGLKAGRHFIELQLPDEHWFVKSVLLPTAPASNSTAREAGRNGVTLKAGEKVSGLAVTLAEGAAGLKGKVIGPDKSRLRVHLLPTEPEAKDDVLRFAEVLADNDGSFSFTNLAPGKYRMFVRVIPNTAPSDKPAKPAAWDAAERAKLRKEAEETANSTIELKPCQRVTEFRNR